MAALPQFSGGLSAVDGPGQNAEHGPQGPEGNEEELWWILCANVRRRFEKLAAGDPSKPGQKARVMMAIVETIEQYGAMAPESHKLLWETSGEELMERQVKDLQCCLGRPHATIVDEMEHLYTR